MKMRDERWYPRWIALFAAVVALAVLLLSGWTLDKDNKQFLLASVTFGAIMAGFIATNFSMVVSFDSEFMKKLRKHALYEVLISYLREALVSAMAIPLLSLTVLFWFDYIPYWGGVAVGTAWWGVLGWGISCFYRAVSTSIDIFRRMD